MTGAQRTHAGMVPNARAYFTAQSQSDAPCVIIARDRAQNRPNLAVVPSMAASPTWMREVAVGDGSHPGATGYPELAGLAGSWGPWQAWVQ
jgi:hypothetical protein